MPAITHKKLNISAELKDFSQAQYEKYHGELLKLTKGIDTAANSNGAVVRAAIAAGFLSGVDYDAVANMSPAAVKWLTQKISEHVTEITTVPEDDDPN